MSALKDTLEDLERQLYELGDAVDQALKAAPVTDEHLTHTVAYWGRSRYVLVQNDGSIYTGIPTKGYARGCSFDQRPAAIRAASGQPGCRIYDIKTAKFVEVMS